MLSLPLITPRDDVTIWLHPTHRQTNILDSTDSHEHPHAPNSSRRGQSRTHSALAQLVADENAIEQRKQNVRRFGAGWIRPPGIAKTYQATMDELAEREEQEMLARRDAQMQELANAQEMEARRQQALEGGGDMDGQGEVEGDEAGERDLDDDVPEAEDVTFNEESLLEGSIVAGEGDGTGVDLDADIDVDVDVERILDLEEAEMTGMLEDDRDLDDDVPEAGSYQHTDTELEDESTDEEEIGEASMVRMSGGRARQSMLSESDAQMMSSSFLSSSPAARQGLARGNAFRERLMQGRQQ
ncbi:hypothetical protein NA57DRAFT_77769 [Rhizodiscina lignyota]|uniref:Apc15p protein-domain-containing protein n=1 Tax=Rhizodiscina lignyota TaxID=1504668 RepID=A0A9P4M7N9_9PEZI|nr:hypothetical protein NA57DRAFT_77769 [Rhizodiscina lignyota]